MPAKSTKAAGADNFLPRLSAALGAIGEDSGLPDIIMDILKEKFGGDHGMLLEPEETTGNLIEIVSYGELEEMLDQDMRIFAQYAMDHPDEKESIIIAPDANKVKKLSARKSVRRDMTKQVLIFPLPADDTAMGVVYMGSKKTGKLNIKSLNDEELMVFGKTFGYILKVDRALKRLTLQNQALHRSVKGESAYENLVGSSEAVNRIKRALELVVPTDIPVTLLGEKGTGKQLIADILHNNSSRKKKPFITFTVDEIPESMVAPMLFGQATARPSSPKAKKGALREAKGGTLFLEGIEKLSLPLQAQLMQAIERREALPLDGDVEYPVDVRLIISSEANLKDLFEANKIRQDLYLHLNIFPILIPPLRDRTEDLPHLVPHFVDAAASSFGKTITDISSEVYDYLGTWEWPGNVAELEQEIRKAVLRTPDRRGTLNAGSLSKHLISKREPVLELPKEGTLKQRIAGIEKRLIMDALEQYKHNQSITSDKLGLSRQALINKLHRYGIETGRKYKRKLREIAEQVEKDE